MITYEQMNEYFFGKHVVVSEKLDGEGTTMYFDHIHARSLDSLHHPSRTVVKQLHGQIAHNIPQDWRVCGENVYAKHSILYEQLTAYFYVFNIWHNDVCLSWKQTKEWTELLGLETVPILYQGIWSEDAVKACWTGNSRFGGLQEGYVVRVVDEFHQVDFQKCVAKYVRKNHVQTSAHWMSEAVVPNVLRK